MGPLPDAGNGVSGSRRLVGAGGPVAGCFSAFGEQIGWGLVWLGAPRRQARGCSAVDLVEDLVNQAGIGNVRYDPQLSAAERAEGDIDFKYALQSLRQVSRAVGGSLQSLRDSVGEHCRVAGTAGYTAPYAL